MDGHNPTLEEITIAKIDIHDNNCYMLMKLISVNNEKYIVIIINSNKLNDPNYLRAIQYKFKYGKSD